MAGASGRRQTSRRASARRAGASVDVRLVRDKKEMAVKVMVPEDQLQRGRIPV